MINIDKILYFWFHDLTDQDTIKKNKPPAKNWFIKNQYFDTMIRDQFQSLIDDASQGKLLSWEKSIEGSLALILLLDQFPRNIFRNSADMYRHDTQALQLSKKIIQKGLDKKASCIERIFIYMPLMHSENYNDQEQCVIQFKQLIQDSKKQCPHNTLYFEYNLKYAYAHLEVIKQFGRFPHRNSILGRTTTPNEKKYLAENGGF